MPVAAPTACKEPACPRPVVERGRCAVHRRSTADRGYGPLHRALRRRWEPQVRVGAVDCARCGRRIAPGDAWDLGHSDDRRSYTGPEHASCNRSARGNA